MRMEDRINDFLKSPEVYAWHKAVDLKPKTRENYTLRLLQVLDEIHISLDQFLQDWDQQSLFR
jgi:hypothetical protein